MGPAPLLLRFVRQIYPLWLLLLAALCGSAMAGDVTGNGNVDLLELYSDSSYLSFWLAVSTGDGRGDFVQDSNMYYVGAGVGELTGMPSSLVLTRLNNQAPALLNDQSLDVLAFVEGGYVASLLNLTNAPPSQPLAVTSSTALQASPTNAAPGAQVTLTSTVTGISPTGSVSFSTGTTTLGTATLSNGMASLQTSFATTGNYAVTASYPGDSNNSSSASNTVTVVIAT
jgi:hypothetical protein